MKVSKPVIFMLIFPMLALSMPASSMLGVFSPAVLAPMTLDESGQHHAVGDYTVENNDWGKGSLVIGKDYIQQVSFNGDSLQNNLTMTWAYPQIQGPMYVYGYPEVIWGNKLGYLGTMKYSNKIKNITNLSVDYSVEISGETDKFDVGMEIWTSDKPWTTPGAVAVNEIMVKVHGWQDGPGTAYSDATLTAIEAVHKNVHGSTFVTLDTKTDKLSGTISFSNILKHLVAKGIVNGNDYVSGVELGAEMTHGYGKLQVNRFSVTETIASKVD